MARDGHDETNAAPHGDPTPAIDAGRDSVAAPPAAAGGRSWLPAGFGLGLGSGLGSGFVSRLGSGLGLRTRLLVMTAVLVMLAELLIFVPTLAAFRLSWLDERLKAAQLAAIAADSYPGGAVPSGIRGELLRTAQVKAVASRSGGQRRLVLPVDDDMKIDTHFDIRQSPDGLLAKAGLELSVYYDTIATLFAPDRTIRVLGRVGADPDDLIEIVMPEAPLRRALAEQTRMLLMIAALISLASALLVYLTIDGLVVRPILRLSRNMQAFSANPEDRSRIIPPTTRTDAIGVAETQLGQMQEELSSLLAQRARLAELGLAVSKINHDLRNMLSSAQLISDRLTALPDPTVQRFAPKLIASLDRAINFCGDTLRYGRSAETTPRRELLLLLPLVEEVGDGLGLPRDGAIDWQLDFEPTLRVDADPDHLFRILSNLVRNAVEALERHAEATRSSGGGGAPGCITVAAERRGRLVTITVADDGPGIPERVRENLFKAFKVSTRKGGTGLGLAISAELAAAHGGKLDLLETTTGAAFRIEIPDRSGRQ